MPVILTSRGRGESGPAGPSGDFGYFVPDSSLIYKSALEASTGTDATSAINSLITQANTDGGGTVLIPGWMRVSTGITMKANVSLLGGGKESCGLYFDDVDSVGIAVTGSASLGSTLSADVSETDRVLNVTSSASFTAGEWIWMQDTTISPTGPTWLARVQGKAAGTLTMYEHSPAPFTSGIEVYRITTFPSDMSIRDLSLWACTTADPTAYATNRRALLRAFEVRNLEMTGCDIRGFGGNNTNGATDKGVVVAILISRNCVIANNNFEWMGSTVTATGVHQVVQASYSTAVDVLNNRFYRCGGSSCINFEGSSYPRANGNRVGGLSMQYNSGHIIAPELPTDADGRGIKFLFGCTQFTCNDNIIYESAFDGIRVDDCSYGTITGNTIWWAGEIPLFVFGTVAGLCHHVTVSGNHVRYGWQTLLNGGALIQVQNAQYVNVVGNTASDSVNYGIYLQDALDSIAASNIVENTGNNGIQIDGTSEKCSIHGNIIRNTEGYSIEDDSSGAPYNHIYGNSGDLAMHIQPATTIVTLDTPENSNPFLGIISTAGFEQGVNGATIAITDPGDETKWSARTIPTAGTLIYDTAHAAHGTLAMKVATAGTAGFCGLWWEPTIGPKTDHYGRFYIYLTGAPSSQFYVMSAQLQGTQKAALLLDTDGTLQAFDAGFASRGTTAAPLPFNQWVRVEYHMVHSTTVGQVEVRTYLGDSGVQDDGFDTGASFNFGAQIDQVNFGIQSSVANVGPFWMDDILDGDTDWPGAA